MFQSQRKKPLKLDDFVPRYGPGDPPPTAEQLAAKLRAWAERRQRLRDAAPAGI